MAALSVLSTPLLPASEGLQLWVSMWGNLFGKTSSTLISDTFTSEFFEGQIIYTEIGRIKLCKIKASPHRVLRNNAVSVLADHRSYKIVVQVRGTSTFEQAGHQVVVRPGEWTIYDAGKSYCVSNPEDVEQQVILLPREVFASARFDLQPLLTQTFSARMGMGRLACGMVRVAFEEFSEEQLSSTDDLGDTIVRLFQQAMLERSGQETSASRTVLLCDRIKVYIENNLRDPNLSIEHLARDLNHTKRNLHRVFASEGLSISEFIWKLRLESSRRALTNPALTSRSITDIAYDCGFSNPAHFSRMFKDTFDVSPRDYRHQCHSTAPISERPPLSLILAAH